MRAIVTRRATRVCVASAAYLSLFGCGTKRETAFDWQQVTVLREAAIQRALASIDESGRDRVSGEYRAFAIRVAESVAGSELRSRVSAIHPLTAVVGVEVGSGSGPLIPEDAYQAVWFISSPSSGRELSFRSEKGPVSEQPIPEKTLSALLEVVSRPEQASIPDEISAIMDERQWTIITVLTQQSRYSIVVSSVFTEGELCDLYHAIRNLLSDPELLPRQPCFEVEKWPPFDPKNP